MPYKNYKIISKKVFSDHIKFYLDDVVHYSDASESYVYVTDKDHYNNFWEGDYVRIDLDVIKSTAFHSNYHFHKGTLYKLSSSAMVASNRQEQVGMNHFRTIGNDVMNRAEQSGGQMEARWIAREEYQTDGSVSARELGWIYRKRN